MEILFGVIIGAAILLVIIVAAMLPRGPDADLIDLEEYTAAVLTDVDRGSRPRPPHTIPGLVAGRWTLEQMGMMEKNRRVAREIYEYAKQKGRK